MSLEAVSEDTAAHTPTHTTGTSTSSKHRNHNHDPRTIVDDTHLRQATPAWSPSTCVPGDRRCRLDKCPAGMEWASRPGVSSQHVVCAGDTVVTARGRENDAQARTAAVRWHDQVSVPEDCRTPTRAAAQAYRQACRAERRTTADALPRSQMPLWKWLAWQQKLQISYRNSNYLHGNRCKAWPQDGTS